MACVCPVPLRQWCEGDCTPTAAPDAPKCNRKRCGEPAAPGRKQCEPHLRENNAQRRQLKRL